LIEGALQAADRAKTLAQRLLAFARRQPLQPTSVNVGTLVKGMAELVVSTTGPQIKIVVEIADDLPAAKADPNQLEMAILNLAVNARDAMPDGGTLRVSATSEMIGPSQHPHLKPGLYIRLSIADTGTGMDEATLARAIEPFFSTKGPGKGTGLGLSMVHGLASQLGGALALSSKPGLGTKVGILLPVSDEPVQASEGTPTAIPELKAIGNVLLVEDDDPVRMSTADMLTELGYDVLEASSAEEALRFFSQGIHVDMLVTDHLMPGMTGVDLARAIKEKWPDIPVLIVSGYAEAEGVAPDLPRLTKPFRQPELAVSIANLTAGRSQ
jgi:CheY-like chemotaxis protein